MLWRNSLHSWSLSVPRHVSKALASLLLLFPRDRRGMCHGMSLRPMIIFSPWTSGRVWISRTMAFLCARFSIMGSQPRPASFPFLKCVRYSSPLAIQPFSSASIRLSNLIYSRKKASSRCISLRLTLSSRPAPFLRLHIPFVRQQKIQSVQPFISDTRSSSSRCSCTYQANMSQRRLELPGFRYRQMYRLLHASNRWSYSKLRFRGGFQRRNLLHFRLHSWGPLAWFRFVLGRGGGSCQFGRWYSFFLGEVRGDRKYRGPFRSSARIKHIEFGSRRYIHPRPETSGQEFIQRWGNSRRICHRYIHRVPIRKRSPPQPGLHRYL